MLNFIEHCSHFYEILKKHLGVTSKLKRNQKCFHFHAHHHINKQHHEKTQDFAYVKTKPQISFAVNYLLITQKEACSHSEIGSQLMLMIFAIFPLHWSGAQFDFN